MGISQVFPSGVVIEASQEPSGLAPPLPTAGAPDSTGGITAKHKIPKVAMEASQTVFLLRPGNDD
jgi:hypothetical protein